MLSPVYKRDCNNREFCERRQRDNQTDLRKQDWQERRVESEDPGERCETVVKR